MYPDTEQNQVFEELTKYLDNGGLHVPQSQIYIASKPIEHLALILFLQTILHLQRITYDSQLSVLLSKSKSGIDNMPLVVGIATVLAQFHIGFTHKYMGYLGQWIRSMLLLTDQTETPNEIFLLLMFLEDLVKFGQMEHTLVQEYIPPFLYNHKKTVVGN